MAQFSLDNYIPVESLIPGIRVHKPSVPQEAQGHVLDVKCPRCQSPITYSFADNGLHCMYCGYYEDLASEDETLRQGVFEEVVLQQTGQGWGAQRAEWHCNNCGANTSVEPELIAFTCPFCGSQKVIQHDVVENAPRPQAIIPFAVSQEACPELAREWFGTSWMTPASLRQLARLEGFRAVYLPFWMFTFTAQATWRVMFKSDNIGASWKERTGFERIVYDNLLACATTTISQVLAEQMAEFDVHPVPYNPKYLAGISALTYDVALGDAWQRVREKVREQIVDRCSWQATPSDHGECRGFGVGLKLEDESWSYILVPAYVAVYRYADVTYQLLVNGQTGQVSGQRPVAWFKVRCVQALIVALALATLFSGYLPIIVLFFILSGIILFNIERQARAFDVL